MRRRAKTRRRRGERASLRRIDAARVHDDDGTPHRERKRSAGTVDAATRREGARKSIASGVYRKLTLDRRADRTVLQRARKGWKREK